MARTPDYCSSQFLSRPLGLNLVLGLQRTTVSDCLQCNRHRARRILVTVPWVLAFVNILILQTDEEIEALNIHVICLWSPVTGGPGQQVPAPVPESPALSQGRRLALLRSSACLSPRALAPGPESPASGPYSSNASPSLYPGAQPQFQTRVSVLMPCRLGVPAA